MNETVLNILNNGLAVAVAVAIIDGIKEAIAWCRKRKADKEDRAEEKEEKNFESRLTKLENDMSDMKCMTSALVDSQKNVLFDRLQYLCRKYISEQAIDFDDLRGVNALHNSYHNGLGGNGDLDALMKQVRELPLKTKKKGGAA